MFFFCTKLCVANPLRLLDKINLTYAAALCVPTGVNGLIPNTADRGSGVGKMSPNLKMKGGWVAGGRCF